MGRDPLFIIKTQVLGLDEWGRRVMVDTPTKLAMKLHSVSHCQRGQDEGSILQIGTEKGRK